MPTLTSSAKSPSAKPPKEGKLLYHLTHINNMSAILASGLQSRGKLHQANNHFQDVADPEILRKREQYQDALSKYVPFHFFAKNPFDCAVAGNVGPENLVLICISRDYARQNGGLIIPSHPLNTNTPELLPYDKGFDKVQWDLMAPGQRNYRENPASKQASMAECVMPQTVPVSAFFCVFVYNEQAQSALLNMTGAAAIRDKLKVNPRMFFTPNTAQS